MRQLSHLAPDLCPRYGFFGMDLIHDLCEQRDWRLVQHHLQMRSDPRRCLTGEKRHLQLLGSHRLSIADRLGGAFFREEDRAAFTLRFIDRPMDSNRATAFAMLRLAMDRFSTALTVERESPLRRARRSWVRPISVLRTRTALPISSRVDMRRSCPQTS